MCVLYHGREYVVYGQIYTDWQKFYTAAGSDGSDKSHLCSKECVFFLKCLRFLQKRLVFGKICILII